MSDQGDESISRRKLLAGVGASGAAAFSLSRFRGLKDNLAQVVSGVEEDADPGFWKQRISEEMKDGELDGNMYEGPAHSYITPENDVVQDWAEKAELEPHPENKDSYIVNFNDEDDLLSFEYITDEKQFDRLDKWMEPEEYLENGAVGDCEDYALAMTSILEAMDYPSINVLGTYTEQGEDDGSRHMITETKVDGDVYVADVYKPTELIPREEYLDNFEWWDRDMFGEEMERQDYDSSWFS